MYTTHTVIKMILSTCCSSMFLFSRQDLASAYCKHLESTLERKAFEDFVNIRNEAALDIGFVNPSLDKKLVGLG